ncbi:signal peptidase complex subunit 1-like isoform X3 [Tasmannia lanceolata]|uniref:signal peptidase complex subunit 1-like isoform X3 n=1 Tax=Tasmannia lanceolata TaxID=3420 RepID=UPI0040633700
MMDWQGQKLSELLMQIMLVVFAIVSFATGYLAGSFQLMLLIYAGGVILTTLVTVPNWSFFNRHPLKWLDPIEAEKHPEPLPPTSKKKSSSKHHQKGLLDGDTAISSSFRISNLLRVL